MNSNFPPEEFHELFRRLRRASKLTQAELAEIAGRKKSWIVDIERGKILPMDFQKVSDMALALGVSGYDLFSLVVEQLTDGRMRAVPVQEEQEG